MGHDTMGDAVLPFAPYAEVIRDLVAQDWQNDKKEELKEQYLAGLLEKYQTRFENTTTAATLDELARARAELPGGDYDVVIEGVGSEHSPAAWADAGATWWLETQWDAVGQARPALATFDRLRDGPPPT